MGEGLKPLPWRPLWDFRHAHIPLWFIYGLYMVYIWFIYGLYMLSIWIIYGESMITGWWLSHPSEKYESRLG